MHICKQSLSSDKIKLGWWLLTAIWLSVTAFPKYWPSEVGCPKFLEIRNYWGKVMERSGLRFKKKFTNKGCKISAQKKKNKIKKKMVCGQIMHY